MILDVDTPVVLPIENSTIKSGFAHCLDFCPTTDRTMSSTPFELD